MPTYWSYSILIDERCVMSASGETLQKALTEAISSAIYYKAVNPQAKITITDLAEQCGICHNTGTVTLRRVRSTKTSRCPECKGKLATGKLADIPLVMPDPANRIVLAQG